MPFTPTTWVDGTTAITATELNRVETGVDDAITAVEKIYAGWVADSGLPGTTGALPTGWSSAQTGTGTSITVTFDADFGDSNYAVVVNPVDGPGVLVACQSHSSGSFIVGARLASDPSTPVYAGFRFVLIRW